MLYLLTSQFKLFTTAQRYRLAWHWGLAVSIKSWHVLRVIKKITRFDCTIYPPPIEVIYKPIKVICTSKLCFRAYLLAAITGMQSYLHDVMSKLVSFCFDLKKDSILLPSRIQYVDEKVNLIKNSRLAVSRNRIFETLMMIISKLKIDLMDQTSSMYKAIDELDQSSNLHEAYEQIECFVMGRVKNLIFIEMASVLTPFDSKPLVRLLEKLQTNVKSTRKYDRIYVSKDQPTYLLKEFIQNPLNEQTFKIQSGLTFSYRFVKLKRNNK